MKVSKAIENLEIFREQEGKLLGYEFVDSVQLGIEALKAIFRYREGYPVNCYSPLPGETPE